MRAVAVLAAAFVSGWGGRAHASDQKPRTPPSFGVRPCLVEVNRAIDPTLVVPYGLPLEDPPSDPPELPDHRTHQFFLACRDLPPDGAMPPWIDEDDVARATMAGLLDTPVDPADVLALSPAWSEGHDGAAGTCVVPLVDKSARRPIECASASEPVVFDTTGLPAGGYVLLGYTFEAPANLWTRRLGVAWIHDGDGAAPPAAALTVPWYEGSRLYVGDALTLRGCAAGSAGTTVTVERAPVAQAADPAGYVPVGTVVLAGPTCGLALPFVAQAEDAGQAWVVRVRAVAPDGAEFVGYAPGKLLVLDGDGTSDPGELPVPLDVCGVDLAGTDPPDVCMAADGSTGGTAGTGTTGGTGAADTTGTPGTAGGAEGAGAGGCGCESGGGGSGIWLWLVLFPICAGRDKMAP